MFRLKASPYGKSINGTNCDPTSYQRLGNGQRGQSSNGGTVRHLAQRAINAADTRQSAN
jgi:hypothetical protein